MAIWLGRIIMYMYGLKVFKVFECVTFCYRKSSITKCLYLVEFCLDISIWVVYSGLDKYF